MPLQLYQDAELVGEERFIRRLFAPKRLTNQSTPDEELGDNESFQMTSLESGTDLTFKKAYQRSFLGADQSFVIVKKREEIAIRIHCGSGGRSEWLNELQVYLIPNFRHKNILNYLGSDQSPMELPRISDIRMCDQLLDSYEKQQATETKENEGPGPFERTGGVRNRLQYWLLNRFDSCIVLRDFLREHSLDWTQMIHIARGIIDGLHYLHENGDYQDIDKDQAIRRFIRSTNGVLKRVAFVDKNSKTLMWPQHTCSVILRNLNSMNIVLKGPNLTPCLWNFGHSKIHHPFQPANHVNLIDKRLKDASMSSPYSSPEVLQERAYLTVKAMKSIDMYACGILFWELLSRCKLPHLVGGLEHENKERADPDPYAEPFEREFGPNPSTDMLQYAVCRVHARPKLKNSWLVGKKSYNFTKTIQDLWDQDFDARVHTFTVIDRLERMDLSNEDSRHDFTPRNSKSFDLAKHWPPKVESIQVPPFLDKCEPNLVFLED